MQEILSKIDSFRKEIHESSLQKDLRNQIHELEKVYSKIVQFLKSSVEPADKDDTIIPVIIGAFGYIKRKKLTYEYNKNRDKMIKEMTENIRDAQGELLKELKVLQSYVTDNKIVEVAK